MFVLVEIALIQKIPTLPPKGGNAERPAISYMTVLGSINLQTYGKYVKMTRIRSEFGIVRLWNQYMMRGKLKEGGEYLCKYKGVFLTK